MLPAGPRRIAGTGAEWTRRRRAPCCRNWTGRHRRRAHELGTWCATVRPPPGRRCWRRGRLRLKALRRHKGGIPVDEAERIGGPVGLLLACDDLWWSLRLCDTLKDVLLVENAKFAGVGKGVRELDDVVVKEWKASLDRVRHQHPVSLGGEQVASQERLGLEVLILCERRPAGKIRRQTIEQFGHRVGSRSRSAHVCGEQALDRAGAAPTRRMSEAGRIRGRNAVSEEL